MFFVVGVLVVIGAITGGYLAQGGHLDVLWQPFEFVIILGAAVGAFLIANPTTVIVGVLKNLGKLITGSRYNRASYIELLCALYAIFRVAKTKGDLALEAHVENPGDSSLFQQFPGFYRDHHAVEFLCDYLRLLTLGATNAYEIEAVMDQELETHHDENHMISGAVTTMSDALPALGIVAAVLGVIHTMGSITEPPEVLGKLIGGALVGTFFGVLMSYGFVGPIGGLLEKVFNAEAKYLMVIRTAIIGHMQGYAPQVAIELARKSLASDVRLTFAEVEDAIQNVPAA